MAYQTIGLQKGNSDSEGKLATLQLPDLAGKSFLDLGCNMGFFCREARCIMLCRHGATKVAVLALSGREDSLGESRRTQEHFANSCNFDNVYTNGNDHD